MFNMLTSRIGSFDDLSVADLFAGSGALGIEALSRGAQSCLFVEREAQAVQTIRDNLAALDATARAVVRAGSALDLPPAKAPHDLILLDPPYDTGAVAVALERLSRMGWIGPATWIALETGAKEDAALRNLEVDAVRRVGSAQIVIARLPGGWTVHPKHRIRKRPPSGVDGGRPIREPFKESQVTRSRN
jgi:16S rRNA (guanine966-N2)-methyltransferase